MATVKTAISIDSRIFQAMERMAKRQRVSRSRLFSQAAEQFLKKQDTASLIEQINRAYANPETSAERNTRRAFAGNFARLAKGNW